MNPHFFTAPFYFAFIWFRALVAASPQLYVGRCPVKNHSRPFLWKGQTSEARRGWHPRVEVVN